MVNNHEPPAPGGHSVCSTTDYNTFKDTKRRMYIHHCHIYMHSHDTYSAQDTMSIDHQAPELQLETASNDINVLD